MAKDILVIAQHDNGELKKTALEALTAGRNLAASLGGEVSVLAIGSGASNTVQELQTWGASTVLTAEGPGLEQYSSLRWTRIINDTIASKSPAAVLMSVSAVSRDLAGRVAARSGGSLASDCVELKVDSGTFTLVRPVLAGRVRLTTAHSGDAPLIASLRPNAFAAEKPEQPGAGAVEALSVTEESDDLRVVVRELLAASGERPELPEAKIVVSGGRSLGSEENFKYIYDLADALGAAAGASRAAVDAGYAPHSIQVGQTGKTVSPALYIASGISGAIQHLAGMRTSKYIVAINTDENAPIFQLADYGIVGDQFEVLPALTEEFKKVLQA